LQYIEHEKKIPIPKRSGTMGTVSRHPGVSTLEAAADPYIKVAFSSPRGAAPSRATVSEVTHLGRAVARYSGADAGFAGQPPRNV